MSYVKLIFVIVDDVVNMVEKFLDCIVGVDLKCNKFFGFVIGCEGLSGFWGWGWVNVIEVLWKGCVGWVRYDVFILWDFWR